MLASASLFEVLLKVLLSVYCTAKLSCPLTLPLLPPCQRPSAALAATVCQLLLLAPPDLLCGPNDPSDARRLLRWLCRLMAHSLPHWNHHTSSGERRPQPQDYTEAIHTDGTTRSLPLPKASYSGCGGAKPCPVPLELARVLLSRVSLPQALEALRYIREHREDGK